jgi:hypothetical protein
VWSIGTVLSRAEGGPFSLHFHSNAGLGPEKPAQLSSEEKNVWTIDVSD